MGGEEDFRAFPQFQICPYKTVHKKELGQKRGFP